MTQGSRSDTIAAIATAAGRGSIAVIRISGSDAIPVADRVFRGRTPLCHAASHTLHHGFVVEERNESHIDEVVAAVFRSPHSYSGEDVVEISCHGGVVLPVTVLEKVLGAGARQAEPGEFTRRAFLNGRMDLSQAEAVMDLVAAESRTAGRVSLAQVEGHLGERVRELRQSLLELCALLELDLDFAEEGLAVIKKDSIREKISAVKDEIGRLHSSYSAGRVVREGTRVVLTGRPNAGKSSLFNAMLKEGRAIVTPHPGTTRDTIEETIELGGVRFVLVDTAGLRKAHDLVEEEGVKRSFRAIRGADILLAVVDPSDMPSEDEIRGLRAEMSDDQTIMWVRNKLDAEVTSRFVNGVPGRLEHEVVVETSATTGQGVRELEEKLRESVGSKSVPAEGVVVTNQRHFLLLGKALAGMEKALSVCEEDKSNELISFELHEGVEALGEITGEIRSEDVLNQIFERFCIGK